MPAVLDIPYGVAYGFPCREQRFNKDADEQPVPTGARSRGRGTFRAPLSTTEFHLRSWFKTGAATAGGAEVSSGLRLRKGHRTCSRP